METRYKILIGIIALIIIFFLVWTNKDNDKKVNKKYDFLMLNGDFHVGKTEYIISTSMTGSIRRTSIHYQFKNNKFYIQDYEISFLKRYNIDWSINFSFAEKGDRFLVLYEKGNEQNSILCLDKPIKNETDFEKYKQEILKWRAAEKN